MQLPEEDEAQPGSEQDMKDNLKTAIDENELGRFFPEGDTYLDDVAKKAAELANDPNNSLKEPPQLRGLASLALYQPVIYCGEYLPTQLQHFDLIRVPRRRQCFDARQLEHGATMG